MMPDVRLPAEVEISGADKEFSSGLLVDLVAALRRSRPGGLVALTSARPSLGPDLEAWARLTGFSIVAHSVDGAAHRWVLRNGVAPVEEGRPVGSRLWLYLNFDCNLACDYCCVRSSPKAPRRALGLEGVRRIAAEAPAAGTREMFVTGGEPMLLPDIGEILSTLCAALPTTMLTNGMLLSGRRLDSIASLPRDRLALQISLDSPDAALHDLHRGAGTWRRTMDGVAAARALGIRVRLAATVPDEAAEEAFRAFLDREGVPAEDRVVRRVALRGMAQEGMALSRADLWPEVTVTADGVWWHPVGADDQDLRVTDEIFPLERAFAAVRAALERQRELGNRVDRIYTCA